MGRSSHFQLLKQLLLIFLLSRMIQKKPIPDAVVTQWVQQYAPAIKLKRHVHVSDIVAVPVIHILPPDRELLQDADVHLFINSTRIFNAALKRIKLYLKMRTLFTNLLIIFGTWFFSDVVAQNDQSYKKEETSAFSFKDVHSFKSADAMYQIADTLPYSNRADLLLKKINQDILNGKLLENDEIWEQVQSLEPFRLHHNMADEADKIAARVFALINSNYKYASKINIFDLKKFSSLYIAGDFDVFIKEGRKLLLRFPGNSDIRNNVALALMHTNRDFCALLELETVRRLDSLHIPTLINLVVVYERLGRRIDAEKLSNRLLEIQKSSEIQLPQVLYNSAWFNFLRGNYSRVNSLLSVIRSENVARNESIRSLREITREEIKANFKKQSIIKIGVMGKLGFDLLNDFFNWYFIIATIVLIALVLLVRFIFLNIKDSVLNIFLQLLVLCVFLAILHIVAWGLPTPEYWYYFAGYSLLPFLLVIALILLAIFFSG